MSHTLKTLTRALSDCLYRDRGALSRHVQQLQRQAQRGPLPADALAKLAADIAASRERVQARRDTAPKPVYAEDLPVVQRRADIFAAIAAHQVVVVCGETGSGKTTQLPKLCLELGRGAAGLIGHTQPRRIAARSVAARIAEELQTPLGSAVGYQVRFTDRIGADSYIKVMTDGILLAEIQQDRLLSRYDTLIIDEAHERSLNIDFLLGYLKRLLPKRPDLKLIITSATIDPERFARHFDNAPVVMVEGRTYPVELRYRPLLASDEDEQDRDLPQAVLDAVDELAGEGPGDVLVFLSGEREIRDIAEALRKHHPPHTEILPLYARLSSAEQDRVFKPHGGRRIVLATNVAETSLTVPGIRYVVDTGHARISRYSARSKVQRLPIEKISRASADQRKGRCGRVAAGVCIRLYDETDFLSRPEFTDPEILRTHLAAVILRMLALGLGDPAASPFIDPPDSRYVNDGYRALQELGAVDDKRRLSALGRQLAKLPVDPRIGRMLLGARDTGCLREVLVIAAALSVPDVRERPADAQQKADTLHRRFHDEQSDFMALLKLWDYLHEQQRHLSHNKFRSLCRAEFLAYLRVREWHEVHAQLQVLCKDMGLKLNDTPADYAAIHRALLTGLLGFIALRGDNQEYTGARNVKLAIFPGSGVRKPPRWIVAAEQVETRRLFARTVARIEPEWVEPIAAHLVRRNYSEPHWERKAAQVAATERVTLYGLPLVAQRKINYGPIDPVVAREIFIRAALVEGDYDTRAAFFAHNHKLIAEVEALEAKSRRRDVLVDTETLYAFYDARIPAGIYSGAQFERWRKDFERGNDQALCLRREDLMQRAANEVTGEQFPATLHMGQARYPLSYVFEPGDAQDGVTLRVPVAALNQLDAVQLEWLVPGLLRERVIALIKSLPKALRRHFVPAPDYADAALAAMDIGAGSLHSALAKELSRMSGVTLSADAWQLDNLPAHLCMRIEVVDEQGRAVGSDRDLIALRERLSGKVQAGFARLPVERHERDGITQWDFDDLPAQVSLQRAGQTYIAWPALVDTGDSVALRLFDTEAEARAALRGGLCRLFMLTLPQPYKYLRKQLPGIKAACLVYATLSPHPWAGQGTKLADNACNELVEDILFQVTESVFLQGEFPRTRAAFEARCAAQRDKLIAAANQLAEQVGAALAAAQQARTQLGKTCAGKGGAYSEACADMQAQLDLLVYRGFVRATPIDWLVHLPRYCNALLRRLERLPQSPDKDHALLRELTPLWQNWLKLAKAKGLPDGSLSPLEEYRWLLEELRVSLFAQTLKTSVPVSVARLKKHWEKLR